MTHTNPGVIVRLVAIFVLGLAAAGAQGAVLVSEGVSHDAVTGRFTYRYAIDNRLGTETVTNVAVLVVKDVGLWLLPRLEHTSPPGWTFVTSVGGFVGTPVNGTFQEWDNSLGVPPGGYLSGFSLTTRHPPTGTAEPNYFLFRLPSGGFDIGTVPAPALPAFLPTAIPTLGEWSLVAFGLIIVAIALRATSNQTG